jgi:hypothetical protein
LHITAKVEVVLSGLNNEGMLYRSGDGDLELPKKVAHSAICKLTVGFLFKPIPNSEASSSSLLGRRQSVSNLIVVGLDARESISLGKTIFLV